MNNINLRISELKKQIETLPAGSVVTKTVHVKQYYYHRQTVNKKRVEKYIPLDEVDSFRKKIVLRKELAAELKQFERSVPLTSSKSLQINTPLFKTNVLTGSMLRKFTEQVHSYERRECYQILEDYICSSYENKVFILYGLRRTGKTTLMRQVMDSMSDEDIANSVFIQLTSKNTMAEVNQDLHLLEDEGYKYIFLDEVTLLSDFIESAALFSDIFVACGMKILLTGTDSLGFIFTEDEQLYDRCIMLHTTFIPYREFESVLNISGIDNYIQYGGTMSISTTHYNDTSVFSTKKKTDEYVDTAIAHNIQHSLRYYQDEGHFRNLQTLYENNELTNIINRVVEDINHRFTLDVLTSDFSSHDLAFSARNLRKDRNSPNDILDHIDIDSVTLHLRNLLEIKNKDELNITVDEASTEEIREYLYLLDIIDNIDIRSASGHNKNSRTIITQPGLRYSQADALISSLMQDDTFSSLSLLERSSVKERIRSEIKGRMMEDIILLETKTAHPEKEVFVLQFPVGEFDMVVFDPDELNCQIYEIKHSTLAIPQQYRHLLDPDKCAKTQHRYGPITRKAVIYRGESKLFNNVEYINVEDYLKGIKTSF